MKKVMILISLMVFMASLTMPAKKADAYVDVAVGIGFLIMFFGGSINEFRNYPECKKEESIGDMAECIEKVKEKMETKGLKKDRNRKSMRETSPIQVGF